MAIAEATEITRDLTGDYVGADAAGMLAPLSLVVWRAASGRQVPHIVYRLVGCPPIPAATYMLVRRSGDGSSRVLAVGRTTSTDGVLNRARIRRAGASLGANEVHLSVVGETDADRARISMDLASGHAALALPAAAGETAS